MENIIKPKEKEVSSDRTGKIFGIIRKKENFQNSLETSLTFSTSEMTKELRNYEIETDLIRAKALAQTRCLTKLL
jgi:hypothetical protein